MKMRSRRFHTRAKLLRQMQKSQPVDAEEEVSAGRLDPRALVLLKRLGKGAKFVREGSQIVGRKELRFGADNRR